MYFVIFHFSNLLQINQNIISEVNRLNGRIWIIQYDPFYMIHIQQLSSFDDLMFWSFDVKVSDLNSDSFHRRLGCHPYYMDGNLISIEDLKNASRFSASTSLIQTAGSSEVLWNLVNIKNKINWILCNVFIQLTEKYRKIGFPTRSFSSEKLTDFESLNKVLISDSNHR